MYTYRERERERERERREKGGTETEIQRERGGKRTRYSTYLAKTSICHSGHILLSNSQMATILITILESGYKNPVLGQAQWLIPKSQLSEGKSLKDHSLRSAWAKSWQDSISANKPGIVIHVFNPSYVGGVCRKITVQG
jgi:hypothetical protein